MTVALTLVLGLSGISLVGPPAAAAGCGVPGLEGGAVGGACDVALGAANCIKNARIGYPGDIKHCAAH